jgi:GTP-binding protein YchF
VKVALVGMMQSGKSTILSAISGKEMPAAATGQIWEAVVPVPDERLDWLTVLYKPKKTVHATINCLDLPGFSFTDEHGRTAARKLVNQVRTADTLVLVVRAFEDPSVAAYRDRVDARAELKELLDEILWADLEAITNRVEKLEVQVNKPTKTQAKDKAELELQKKLLSAIEAGTPLRTVIEGEDVEIIRSFGFLTLKPMIVLVNAGEGEAEKVWDFKGIVHESVPVVGMCAKLEKELSQLDSASRAEFMKDMGLKESGAKKFIAGCYEALGLISFLTSGEDEVRAWPIPKDTTALDAAGKIHSDIKRGFIRAETVAYEDIHRLGDEKAVKAAGRMRLEGKGYVVQDGDIINFRFNV